MFELALYTMFQQSPWPAERPFVVLDGRTEESGPYCGTSAFLFRLEPIIVEFDGKAKWERTSATFTTGVSPHSYTRTYRRLETSAEDLNGDGQIPLVFFEADNFYNPPATVRGTRDIGSLVWYDLPLPVGRYLVFGRRQLDGNDYFSYRPGMKVVNSGGFLKGSLADTPGSLQLWRTPSSNAKELAVMAMYPTTKKSIVQGNGLLSMLIRLVDEAKSDEEMFYYAKLFLRGWFDPEDNPLEDNRAYDDQVREAGALAASLAHGTENVQKKALFASIAVRLGREDLWRTAVEAHFSLKIRNPNLVAKSGFMANWLYPGPNGIKSNKGGRGRFLLEQVSRLPMNDQDGRYLTTLLAPDWQEDMKEPAREIVSRIDYSATRPIGQRYSWSSDASSLARLLKIDTKGLTNDQIVEALKKKLGF